MTDVQCPHHLPWCNHNHGVSEAPDALGVAWYDLEAAVDALRNPKDAPHVVGWGGPCLYHFDAPPLPGASGPYGAKVSPPWDEDGFGAIYAFGTTPVEAVRTLIAKLREKP